MPLSFNEFASSPLVFTCHVLWPFLFFFYCNFHCDMGRVIYRSFFHTPFVRPKLFD